MASMALQPKDFSSLSLFFKTQIWTKGKPPPKPTSFSGSTALVTGSNVGIGLETCKQLLRYGLTHLIMAVRTVSKGEAAASSLRNAYPAAKIEVWALGMGSYESIQSFAQRCAGLASLDTAILNAAVFNADFKLGAAGHEETFQVNYLSTALLSMLLLPVLRQSSSASKKPGRLTIVSSNMGLTNKFSSRDAVPLLPSFSDAKLYGGDAAERYATTKMLVLMLTHSLSQHVRAQDVVVNAVDPGLTAGSSLHRSFSGAEAMVLRTAKAAARSPEQAAWLYLDAAAVKGSESHGGFVVNWELYPLHPFMYTPEGKRTTDRLWQETVDELEFARVKDILAAMQP